MCIPKHLLDNRELPGSRWAGWGPLSPGPWPPGSWGPQERRGAPLQGPGPVSSAPALGSLAGPSWSWSWGWGWSLAPGSLLGAATPQLGREGSGPGAAGLRCHPGPGQDGARRAPTEPRAALPAATTCPVPPARPAAVSLPPLTPGFLGPLRWGWPRWCWVSAHGAA